MGGKEEPGIVFGRQFPSQGIEGMGAHEDDKRANTPDFSTETD